MSDPFIGEIRLLPYTYVPYGWASCNGQLLSVAAYQALFAVLGTAFGGDGRSTFGVPDLRARVVMGAGLGPGLTQRTYSQSGGVSSVTLSAANIPNHSHTMQGTSNTVIPGAMTNALLATVGGRTKAYVDYAPTANYVNLNANSLQPSGAGQPTAHENRQPFLALQYCIALEGLWPDRPN